MDAKIDTAQLLNQATAPTKKPARGRDPQKIKEQAQEFEAVFIQQVFKEMRKTIPDGGLIERDSAEDTFTQLQDLEAARVCARKGGIGLAELMTRQLLEEK